jgi:hypothetical protein
MTISVRREIPRSEWTEALRSFALQHDRWLVTVETGDSDKTSRMRVDEPLEELVVQTKGPLGEVAIAVGGTHIHVHDVMRIEIETEGGVDRAVRIEDRLGKLTRIQLRIPMPPELVDGM